jgi:hypothetical protein
MASMVGHTMSDQLTVSLVCTGFHIPPLLS